MKYCAPLACVFLILAYAAVVEFFYRDEIESDLTAKAESLIAGRSGLENVSVEFHAFDAYLWGNVSSPELIDEAEELITSLPAARVFSNDIAYSSLKPARTPTPKPAAAPSPAEPAPAPVQAPKPAPRLHIVAREDSISLGGAVPDVTTKGTFLTAIALSGRYLDVHSGDLTIDPSLPPTGWPAELPRFLSLLLTRTNVAVLSIDRDRIEVTATAIDSVAREQVLRRLDTIDFPGRHLKIDLAEAEELEGPAEAFFFKAVLVDGKLAIQGRLGSAEAKEKLDEICRTDLAGVEITDEISVVEDLAPPDWSARIPHLLSLVCNRTLGARVTATGEVLHIIGEMNRLQAPEDLADSLLLMLGPGVELKTRLLAYEDNLSTLSPPSEPDSGAASAIIDTPRQSSEN